LIGDISFHHLTLRTHAERRHAFAQTPHEMRDNSVTRNNKRGTSTKDRQAKIEFTRDEVADLVALARHYERTMGVSRHFVRFASGTEMRNRFQFVAEESKVLEQFASAMLTAMDESGDVNREIQITPRALIAFWGRALSSLDSSRSRRKLSPSRLELRMDVERKLQDAVTHLHRENPGLVEAEIATRRSREAVWMNERLHSE
jgi:hypothetical protein